MAEITAQQISLPNTSSNVSSSPIQSNRAKRMQDKKSELAKKLEANPMRDGSKEVGLEVAAKPLDLIPNVVGEQGNKFEDVEVKQESKPQVDNPADAKLETVEAKPSEAKPPVELSPLDRLMAESLKLAKDRKPVAVKPQVQKPQELVESSSEEVITEAVAEDLSRSQPATVDRRYLLSSLSEELGADPDEVFRRLAAEYEAQINGREVPEYKAPVNPALRAAEGLRAELEAVKQQNQKLQELVEARFSNMEQEREQFQAQTKLQRATTYLNQQAKKFPYIAKSDQTLMSQRLVDLVDLAAQHAETQGLTLDELTDKLEAQIKQDVDRYKDLYVSSGQKHSELPVSEAQKSSVATNTAQTPGTLVPGQLNAGSGQNTSKRLSEADRKERAMKVWKSS